jgi:hypothetical protein
LTLPNVSPADRSSGMGLGLRGATILTLMLNRDWCACWPRRSIARQKPRQKFSVRMAGVSRFAQAKFSPTEGPRTWIRHAMRTGACERLVWSCMRPWHAACAEGGAPWAMAGHGSPRGIFIQERRAAFYGSGFISFGKERHEESGPTARLSMLETLVHRCCPKMRGRGGLP